MFSKKDKYFIKDDDSSLELEDMSFDDEEESLGRVEYSFNKKLLDFFWYSLKLTMIFLIILIKF